MNNQLSAPATETSKFYQLIKLLFTDGSEKDKKRVEKIEAMYDNLKFVDMNEKIKTNN